MTDTRELILKLKEVRQQKGLSYNNILDLMEKNGDYMSKSTLSRVFAEGSEDRTFMYDETILPIANVLLDYIPSDKNAHVDELEHQLQDLQEKYYAEINKELEQSRRSIEFLMNQVLVNNRWVDMLLNSIVVKEKEV